MTTVESRLDPWYQWFLTGWGIVVLSNAVIGLCVFEFAWYKLYRYRNPNKALD
jgi:hypothetical protein